MSISGTLSVIANLIDTRAVGLNPAIKIPANLNSQISYTDGAGANQGNILYQGQRTFSGSTDNVDLSGVLTDSFGTTISAARIKGIVIVNISASNSITVGNGTNPWATLLNGTGTLTLPPGAFFAAATPDATGWAVTNSTADILKLAGTSGQSYYLILLGASS
mgnify:CR=1 FL=1